MKLPIAIAATVVGLGACVDTVPPPTPDTSLMGGRVAADVPVALTYTTDLAMEARVTGRLTREGPCLYLDGRHLILWSDDVAVGKLDDGDWLVSDYTTSQRFREGDLLEGGGGSLPERADLGALTGQAVPPGCDTGRAVQFHSVRKVVNTAEAREPRPTPPPPPSIIDEVKRTGEAGGGLPAVTVAGIADPREALFVHLVTRYRKSDSFGPRTICLSEAGPALVARIASRFDNIRGDEACDWQEGGVIDRRTGEPALFVHARLDCTRRECAAEGGATYGNLGAEGYGYRLRRKGDGWSVQEIGIMWIS